MTGKRKLILTVIIAIILIALFGIGIHVLENIIYGNEGQEEKSSADSTAFCIDGKDYSTDDDVEAYLLIGTDGSHATSGDNIGDQGSMADVLMLLVFNDTTRKYGMIPINRDTITTVYTGETDDNDCEIGNEVQICIAHAYGESSEDGCENTIKCTSELFGNLPIVGYYSVNMASIGKINSFVGGVTVTVPEDLSSEDSSLTANSTVTLSDSQAETFVRARMGVGDGTNTSRMKRQKIYMEAYLDKLQANMENDSSYAAEFYKEMSKIGVTDISGSQATAIARKMMNYESLGIIEVDGTSKIGTKLDDGKKHAEFYPDYESITDILKEICRIKKL